MLLRTAGWQATKLANLTRTAGVTKEQARQKSDDALILALMHEKQVLSSMDTQAESGADPYQSRAVFSWLSDTAQTTLINSMLGGSAVALRCYVGTAKYFLAGTAYLTGLSPSISVAGKADVSYSFQVSGPVTFV
jgi:hypothetical protein